MLGGRDVDTLFGGDSTILLPDGGSKIPPSVVIPAAKPIAPVVIRPVIPDVDNSWSGNDDKVVVDSSDDTITIDMGNPEITQDESPEVREARIAYVKAMREYNSLQANIEAELNSGFSSDINIADVSGTPKIQALILAVQSAESQYRSLK